MRKVYTVTMISKDGQKFVNEIVSDSKEKAETETKGLIVEKGWDMYEYKVLDIQEASLLLS